MHQQKVDAEERFKVLTEKLYVILQLSDVAMQSEEQIAGKVQATAISDHVLCFGLINRRHMFYRN